MVRHDAARSGRFPFIQRVAATFAHARVGFVLLNGSRPDHAVDSDLDVGIRRDSRATADMLVRTGYFGRLIRVARYDVPWCGTYTLEVREAERRFRQLDLACDPWNINRLGSALAEAIDAAADVDDDGLPRPEPAAEAVYLCVQKAVDRKPVAQAVAEIREAMARAPSAALRLRERYGQAGAALAAVLESRGWTRRPSLAGLRAAVVRERREPRIVAGRIVFGAWRLANRLGCRRARGLPRGAGRGQVKTLGDGLTPAVDGLFARSLRLHAGPGLLPTPSRILGRPPPRATRARLTRVVPGDGHLIAPARPLARPPAALVAEGLARSRSDDARARRARLARRRRRPRPLPHPAPPVADPGVVSTMPATRPRPVLDAPGRAVLGARPKLTPSEVTRQLSRWSEQASRGRDRYVIVDTSQASDEVVDDAIEAVVDRLAVRQFSARALRARDALPRADLADRLELRDHRPPPPAALAAPDDRPRARPTSWQLYRPADRPRAIGALGLELLNATPASVLLRKISIDTAAGLTRRARADPRPERAPARGRSDRRRAAREARADQRVQGRHALSRSRRSRRTATRSSTSDACSSRSRTRGPSRSRCRA